MLKSATTGSNQCKESHQRTEVNAKAMFEAIEAGVFDDITYEEYKALVNRTVQVAHDHGRLPNSTKEQIEAKTAGWYGGEQAVEPAVETAVKPIVEPVIEEPLQAEPETIIPIEAVPPIGEKIELEPVVEPPTPPKVAATSTNFKDEIGKNNNKTNTNPNDASKDNKQTTETDDKGFPIKEASVAMVTAGTALFLGNSKTPQPDPNQPQQGQEKPGWFRRNFKLIAKILLFAVAADATQAAFRNDKMETQKLGEKAIGYFTGKYQDEQKAKQSSTYTGLIN